MRVFTKPWHITRLVTVALRSNETAKRRGNVGESHRWNLLEGRRWCAKGGRAHTPHNDAVQQTNSAIALESLRVQRICHSLELHYWSALFAADL
jgi:hypothetical protein